MVVTPFTLLFVLLLILCINVSSFSVEVGRGRRSKTFLPASRINLNLDQLKRMEESAAAQPPPTPVQLLNKPSHLSDAAISLILKRHNLIEATKNTKNNDTPVTYTFSLATNMFTTKSNNTPHHIPILVEEEVLLRDKGWGFLDVDESGPPGS
ncbi:hypothetical protein TrLO_g13524 [Triparma laevis f. longispina]|uniref:Uncharacterized protein n=1 Tax=Triparma laevis f. longispina TaxID=1714387 RepID=A0A9W7KZJ2_9STRA|nr:hypothetical protein TrLO_g13524 [Triparma laevis f. longispina]